MNFSPEENRTQRQKLAKGLSSLPPILPSAREDTAFETAFGQFGKKCSQNRQNNHVR